MGAGVAQSLCAEYRAFNLRLGLSSPIILLVERADLIRGKSCDSQY